VLSASCLIKGMVDSNHNLIFLFYYLLTSTSLYVLLQYYVILRESLPYTLYNLNYSYELRCATMRCNYRELRGLRKHPHLTELYESMKSMVQSKMFDQNSSKLTAFHIPHTNRRTTTKQITIINAGTYTSTKHELLIYPNTRNSLLE